MLLIATGSTVTGAATASGYANTGAFIAAFRDTRRPPSRDGMTAVAVFERRYGVLKGWEPPRCRAPT
jgi:AraC-like DNA-binding protein